RKREVKLPWVNQEPNRAIIACLSLSAGFAPKPDTRQPSRSAIRWRNGLPGTDGSMAWMQNTLPWRAIAEVPTNHVAMVSHPDDVVQLIEVAAQAAVTA